MTSTNSRWMVVDCDGEPLFHLTGMYSEDNAREEAEWLNRHGLVEFRPYAVERDSNYST